MISVFKIIPRLSWTFSKKNPLRFVWLLLCLEYFFITRKLTKINKKYPITFYFNNKKIKLQLIFANDLAVLKHIFLDKEYDWCPVPNPKIIVDLGAHFGDTALYYHACFPDAKIISVEPDLANYQRLIEHTRDIPQITCIQAAMGDVDGTVDLHVMDNSLSHSISKRSGTQSSVTVRQITLPTLLRECGVNKADLIKFDIEGAEDKLFNNIDPSDFASSYIGETHEDLMSVSIQEFKDNFKNTKIYEEIAMENKMRKIVRVHLI